MTSDKPFYLGLKPSSEKADASEGVVLEEAPEELLTQDNHDRSEDRVRFKTCECGHDLSAHQLNRGNLDQYAQCAGCAQQYGHGGCRAGGFQNADTRLERLAHFFSAAAWETAEAKYRG
jgi:hypothetical protein